MRKAFLFLTALLMMVGNGLVKADNIQVSTIQPGYGTPEHGYTMQTYANNNINGNRFVGEDLTPSDDDGDKAYLVFYEGDKGSNSYYIYNYSQSKWLSVASIFNGRDRIEMTDSKSNASQFYITSVSNKNGYYQLQPYNGNNAASFYVNYFEGFDQNNNGNNRLGFWQDNGNNDGGSAWQFAEVTLPTSSIIITDQSQLTNEKVYTLTTVNLIRGKAWYANTNNLTTLTKDFGSTDLNPQITYNENDQYQQFAFISADNGATHYLYSKGRAKFVNIDGSYSDKPVNPIYLMKQPDNTFVLKFDNSHFLNMGGSSQPVIDGWGPGGTTSGSSADDGNKLVITAVADFDPADALSKFGVSPAEFDGYMLLASKYLERSSLGVVGYPIAEQTVFNNLRTAWATIMGKGYAEGTFDYNATDCNALIDAYNAYINSTDVKMPEDGKAYVIRNVHQNGNQYMLSSQYENAYMPESTENAKDDVANIFICRTTTNGYVFVNGKHGQYMLFHGKNSVYPLEADGFSDAFSGNNELKLNSHNSDLMGSLSIAGKRNSDKADGYATMTIATDGNMNANEGQNSILYNGSYSSLFLFEEVAYPNNVKLTAFGEDDELITNLEGNTIGTFSAPFPTVVPFDPAVEAYYAEQVKGTDYVKLKAIGVTDAIPANQGVILVGKSESATSALMKPATVERAADLSSNMFAHTAGVTTTTAAGDYVLARGNQGIGFYEANAGGTLAMNKAFLRMGTSNVAAFRLVVDEEVTAIDGVTTEKADAPIYDLSGRRVLNTIKGGIYIQNGKKFIVK